MTNTYIGIITKEDNYFVIKNLKQSIGLKRIQGKFYLENTYVSEFFYSKYKNQFIEFSAVIHNNNGKKYLKNINNVKKAKINFSKNNRRLELSKYKNLSFFTLTFFRFQEKTKTGTYKYLFKNIYNIKGEFVADHVFLEMNYPAASNGVS